MRNLKRALSLALASVMVMGLAVVGSNASYVDVTSKQNQEAIEVLQKVGIMVGDENGKFNPEAKVTRNEMAVIMANLMDYRVSTYKGTSPFTDVPAWAEPYVAACYTNGIVSGYDAKTFGGNDSVATSQAALMLMKALGYFQYQSDFEGDWQLSTVKNGNKIDLFDGVASGVRESMNRNDVAQLVLNALKSGTVEADDDTIKVVTGDTKVEAGKVKYNYITSGKDYAYAIDSRLGAATGADQISGNIVQLGEKLYNGDLKLKGANDDFGAPSNRWTYKNQEIGNYAKSPDYTFSGVVKSNQFYDAVGKTVANGSTYTWSVYIDGEKNMTYKDGDNNTKNAGDLKTAVNDNNKKDLDATFRGSNTYVYLDDDVVPHTATVVVKSIYAGEITKVKDGTVTIDDMNVGSTLDFDTTGYAEGDMVLYNKTIDGSKHEVQAILGKAEMKEGTIETVRDQNRIVIDGTTYKYADKFNPVNDIELDNDAVNQTVSFYLDGQGNIIAFKDTAVNQEYAFVYSVGDATSQYNNKDTDYGAKLVMTDGTVKSVTIDSDDTDRAIRDAGANSGTPNDKLKAVQNHFGWTIVAYSVNDNGTYSLTVKDNNVLKTMQASATKDVIKNGTSRINTKDGTVYADKNTVYLINEKTDDGDDFNVYVGYNNVPNVNALIGAQGLMGSNGADRTGSVKDSSGVASTTGYTVYAKNGVAKVVVITDCEVKGANDVIYVVGDPSATRYKTGSTEYYVLDAVVNGEVTSIKVKADTDAADYMMGNSAKSMSAVAKNQIAVFFGMTKNASGYVTKLTVAAPNDVEVNGYTNKSTPTKLIHTDLNAISHNTDGTITYYGTKREGNGGTVSFGYKKISGQVSYDVSLAANDKATIVYYDGEDLSVVNRLNTDNDDKALYVTDDGEVISILVLEIENGTLSHG